MQRRGISDRALQAGAYGGARHGIAGSEYDAASDMNRALMESQMLQQGYGQAQAGSTDSLSNNRWNLAQVRFQECINKILRRWVTVGALQQGRAYKREVM